MSSTAILYEDAGWLDHQSRRGGAVGALLGSPRPPAASATDAGRGELHPSRVDRYDARADARAYNTHPYTQAAEGTRLEAKCAQGNPKQTVRVLCVPPRAHPVC